MYTYTYLSYDIVKDMEIFVNECLHVQCSTIVVRESQKCALNLVTK